jgi:hypothetical protein
MYIWCNFISLYRVDQDERKSVTVIVSICTRKYLKYTLKYNYEIKWQTPKGDLALMYGHKKVSDLIQVTISLGILDI